MQRVDPVSSYRTPGILRAPLRPRRRAPASRRRWVWVVSAALHGLLLAALLIRPPEPAEQPLPPPQDVALVFEHASRTPPKAPQPAAKTELPAAGTPRPAPVPRPPMPEPPTPEPPTPEPPTPEPPVAPPLPAPVPAPPVPAPPVTPPPVPPAPPAPTPPLPAPVAPVPEPAPTVTATPTPRPVRPHPAAPRPAPAARPPAPRPQARSAFPQPMMRSWSLGTPSQSAGAFGPAETGRSRATQAAPGSEQSGAYDVRGAEALGTDWLNEFSEWVEEHKRYPEPAAANDEDGTNQVSIRIRRDGQVEGVGMEQRSGSHWLDMGTLSLFRDRRLPPFPPDAKDDEITIQFTMHYVIVR